MESSSEEIIHALLLMPDRLLTNGAFAAALESPAAKLCNFGRTIPVSLQEIFY